MNVLWLPAGSKVPLGMRRHWAAYLPALPDPFGAWELNEGSGSLVNDSSGKGNTGTLTNMDPATDWVPTPRGVGLDFDGSNDYINVGPCRQTLTALSVWSYLDTTVGGGAGVNAIFANSTSGASGFRLAIYQNKLRWSIDSAAGTAEVWNSSNTLTGWHSIIGAMNAATDAGGLYVDGMPVGFAVTAGTSTSAISAINTTIGAETGGAANRFSGAIGFLHFWDDILLTASQVAALEGPVPIWQRQRYYQIGGALQYLTPGSVVAASALGSPSLGLGAVTLTPASNVAASAVGAPTVTPGAVGLTPASVAADSALGTPTVTPGSLGITPSSIVGASTPGTPTITSGSKSLSPASLTASSGVGIPTISEGALALLVNSIIAQTALGMPLITASGSLLTDVAYPLAATFGARQELAATAVVRLDSWSEDGTTLGLLVPLPAWVETDLRFRVRIDDILGAAVDLTKFRLRSLIEDPEDGIAVGEFRLTVENINTLLFEWDATGAEAGRAYVFDLRAKDRGGIRSRPVHGTIVMLPVVT